MIKRNLGRIGVLAGGPSSEREISLKSGRAIYNALRSEGLDTIFLDVWDDIRDIVQDNRIDVAFIALHGRFGEDGTVQRILEDARVPYTGSGVEASRLALDKIASREVFKKCDIPVPKYIVLEKERFRMEDIDILGLPVVVKPQFEGSSIGLSIVKEIRSLKEAMKKAFKYGPKIILEEYIDGRELTVGVLEDRPLPVIEIITRGNVYDYHAKYDDPETIYIVPAELDENIYEKAQKLGIAAHKALGCKFFSRVDMMMDKKGFIFVLEVNTIPGMTERSLLPKAAGALGLNFSRLCVKLVEGAYEAKEEIQKD